MRPVSLIALLAAAAFAQTAEEMRTFTFAHTPGAQQMQEMVNMIRVIAEVQRVAADPAQRTMAAGGTPDQLGLVTWLFTELDRPASRPATLLVRNNTFNDPRWPAVRIFYPSQFSTGQQAQEAVNAVRSIAEIQRVVALIGPGAIVIRANSEQAAFAEWILGEMDRSMSGKRPTEARAYDYPETVIPDIERRATAARIYYPASVGTPQDIREMVNAIRSIAEVQRVVAFTAAGSIVARSSRSQAELTVVLFDDGMCDGPTLQVGSST